MSFYWQHARDSVFTPTALRMFQIACNHDGEEFEVAKGIIDEEYQEISGRTSSRHGGLFQSQVSAFEEVGWIMRTSDGIMQVTPLGRQAELVLNKTPNYLKVVPYFIVELLSRYQLNNPAKPRVRKGDISEEVKRSNVFPYWTIWKIMRSCENKLTTDELRRFVFQLHDSNDIEHCIDLIKRYRQAKDNGATEDELNAEFPAPLEGAVGEPKYLMARAGVQVGVMSKPRIDTYELNSEYIPFIDEILENEPIFREHLTVESWMADYARAVEIDEENLSFIPSVNDNIASDELTEDDPIYSQVSSLLEDGALNFMLSGPPGTSKSWYARQLAYKLTDGDPSRVHLVQFHPSFGYEDFVEGYVPEDTDGSLTFRLVPKLFMTAAQQARSGKSVVLLIDEFSRGDSGRIFGEILTYIEPDYRNQLFSLASGHSFSVPNNLYLIATMNPYDRSVTDVDAAMQRRFEILNLKPSVRILRKILTDNNMDSDLIEKVVRFFNICQDKVPFGGLGQAYFLRAKDKESLLRVWKYKLEPMFELEFRYETDVFDQISAEFMKVITD